MLNEDLTDRVYDLVKDVKLETTDRAVEMLHDMFPGEEWIEHIILSRDHRSMQELADQITDEAITRRKDGHDDDITVIAMRILNNS